MRGDGKRAYDDLLKALTAERYAPVPPSPDPETDPVTAERAARNRRQLQAASRPNYPEHW